MKFFRRMKFGVSETELPLQPHHRNKVRCKQLPLEYVTKEDPYKDFIEGEMKFGRPKASEGSLTPRKLRQRA
ncbi:hypothetical protein COCNU_14G009780 [Cocos nucifera]|uniref:Uncharacterized protein n=1 Tax=Cocos nucifera TaxID=13894 RepID=A0A8K0IVX1_COCNU|nr:hypothetical protein COCNU_14G009780 [Cocos nucifera]